jgi:hypothetical protein
MAESVQLPATGTGTADIKVAVDTIGGEHYQRVKIAMGVDGTFDKDVSATDPLPITAASGKIASGAVASGAIASGAVASGAVASGAVVDGAIVTLGAKADDKSTATDTTAISLMSVAKELSFVSQAINTKLATGTVIGDVNLGATDNAVLDGLETHLHSIDGKMVTGTDIGDVTINNAAGAAGVNIQDGGNVITVDGAVTVDITKIAGASVVVGAGTEATALRITIPTDCTGLLSVDDNGSSLTVDNADITSSKTALELLDNSVDGNYLNVNQNIAGTDVAGGNGAVSAQTQRVTIANDSTGILATVGTVTTLTGGGVAHDADDSGNPVKIGYKVESNPGDQVCANAARTDGIADLDGAHFVRSGCTLGDCLYESVSNTNGSATASAVFTTGAGVRNIITDITVYNTSACWRWCYPCVQDTHSDFG